MEPQDRQASRLVVVDKERRVLLFQYEDHRGKWWATPGGGLEAAESFDDAAAREAQEELGLVQPPMARLWDRVTEFESKGIALRQTEQYYLVRTDEGSLALYADVHQAHLTEGILVQRWWSIGELRTTTECVFPEDLCSRMDHLIAIGKL